MFHDRGLTFGRLEHLIQELNPTTSKLVDNYYGLHQTRDFISILKLIILRLMFVCVVCYLAMCKIQNGSIGKEVFML